MQYRRRKGGTCGHAVAHWALTYRNILNKRDLTFMEKSWKALQILEKKNTEQFQIDCIVNHNHSHSLNVSPLMGITRL